MARRDAPVPPQNLEAEESVLGAMLIAPGAIDRATEILTPADFYRETHAKIFTVCATMHAEGRAVDAITVADELQQRGELDAVGGAKRIHELALIVPASANVAHYARIVREMAALRDVIRFSQESARLAWERDGDAAEIIERVQEGAFALTRSDDREDVPQIGPATVRAYERLTALYESGNDVTGLATGFIDLDHMTAGLQLGNLIIVAARPSMGKTAFGIGVTAHVALRLERPVAFFTLEMSEAEIVQRLIAHEGMVDLHKLRSGRLTPDDWAKVTRTSGIIERAPIFVDDSGSATMADIRARARRLKLHHPELALVVVDYLQLIGESNDRENRTQEVSKISRGLKVMARELQVPVLALSQLSRAPEQRHDKRPMLSDLRESGSVEQDADLVLMTYRDEYYNPEDPEVAGIAEVNVAKQRNGPVGMIKLTFLKHHARFSNPVKELPGMSTAVPVPVDPPAEQRLM